MLNIIYATDDDVANVLADTLFVLDNQGFNPVSVRRVGDSGYSLSAPARIGHKTVKIIIVR